MVLGSLFKRKIQLSGYMIVRNVARQGYPFIEAILSVLPWCDEFLVQDGFSDDETWEMLKLLRDRFPKKVQLYRDEWKGSTRGGEILATMSNRLRERCRGAFCLNLQANEVVPAESMAHLAQLPKKHPKVDLFKIPFLTFMGPQLAWALQYRARIFRNDSHLISLGDAFDVGVDHLFNTQLKKSFLWECVELVAPIRRFRGLFPINYLRKVEGRLSLFQEARAHYFTQKELTYGRRILADCDREHDSPGRFWEKMQVYLEEEMWIGNPPGLDPESDTVRPMIGLIPGSFAPLLHLSGGWEYDSNQTRELLRLRA